jgi:hypothetical protein
MNAHAERFNRTVQESFVDYHEELLFTDLALFNRKLADWLVFYNAERPHHSLGQQSPLSFLLEHQPECQRYWTHTPPCHSEPGYAILRKGRGPKVLWFVDEGGLPDHLRPTCKE